MRLAVILVVRVCSPPLLTPGQRDNKGATALTMSSMKRPHTPSPSRALSPAGTPKAQRVSAPVRSPLLCTLPPTCNLPNHPTPLSDTRALEAHYAAYHAHVCSSTGCGCVFPDARLLGLVRPCIPFPLFSSLTRTFCSTSQSATTHWLRSTENVETKL